MELLPLHLLIFVVFVNRYLLGLQLRWAKGERFDRVRTDFEPNVCIIVPMFNEGESIYHTIQSLLGQRYPAEKLSVVVVDDCSRDDSFAWAQKAADESPRVRVVKNPANVGKRRSINHAVRSTSAEVVVSVDSDVIVDPDAVRHLISRFSDPAIAAVGGRVRVLNADENWLTRMQAIKYFFGYEYLKNLERVFSTVMCLSGCLTAYRRAVLLELEPILENRSVLGVPIKYGEDRFLTRQIVKAGYKTVLTLDASCMTKAPNTLPKYFAQQLRWRQSNLVDFLGGVTHCWSLPPFVGVHYVALFATLVGYPALLTTSVLTGNFVPAMATHVAVLAVLALIYGVETRHESNRVSPVWFLAMAVLMPATYLVCTPLAAFTLDSGNWETRGGTPAPAEAAPVEPTPLRADSSELRPAA